MKMPEHVAIIMDGNGRWAQKRGLPRIAGHRQGFEVAKKIIREAGQLGIKVVTLYAFSTENWKRPEEEVKALMMLLEEALDHAVEELHEHRVCLRVIGRREELPARIQEKIKRAEDLTRNNPGLILVLAINYGGRAEIIDATRKLVSLAAAGGLQPEDVDEPLFTSSLYTAGLPDPDLLIRPSGEMRLSNFLLWQVAYTEFYSTPVLWPDFTVEEFHRALASYQQRHRRFGGLNKE